ncbi:MAG: translation initiation factor 1A [Methanobacteriota archaeon]|jgi:translation initiation factor 1A|uniref:Translation initiation factor 1A n=1 Tax=Halorutilus salinus TaxID=2487751 RepID=A0A9Q4GJY7_9EURY|nr:translation initiation factor eIF-1A [Halorutilus salinus]MCX2819681.1 translation initiation factor eIF-1A [Halorutilus salinus]
MSDDSDLRLPDDDEVLGIVESMLGANRLKVRCMDGETRTARIPGRMKKRVWINEDDVVIVEPWDWQDEKADVNWRYEGQAADELREEGYL